MRYRFTATAGNFPSAPFGVYISAAIMPQHTPPANKSNPTEYFTIKEELVKWILEQLVA